VQPTILNPRAYPVTFVLWLVMGLNLIAYLDNWAIAAVTGHSTNPSGQLVFGSGVYPFTLAAALICFTGVAYVVYRAERKHGLKNLIWSVFLSLLVANAATIGAALLYEQFFIVPYEIHHNQTYWFTEYWGYGSSSPWIYLTASGWTLMQISWIFAILPWVRRDSINIRLALISAAVFLGCIGLWWMIGYPDVQTGVPLAYFFNAVSRIACELIPLCLIFPFNKKRQALATREQIPVLMENSPAQGSSTQVVHEESAPNKVTQNSRDPSILE
jgi:hypothetical protein